MEQHYSIHIYKQYLNFSAAHFIIFPNQTREPLHGHNYRLEVRAKMPHLVNDMVFDFLDIKPLLKKVCNTLDHRCLLPLENPHLTITYDSENESYQCLLFEKERFSFPQKDILLLPLSNTSAERLAIYLAHKIQEEMKNQFQFEFEKISVELEETPGQSAFYEY